MPHSDLLIIIPARGGSKGIPGKNIVPLNGKPLLAYTIEAARASEVSSFIYVSTDCPKIAAVAEKYGAGVIHRPADLANDTASTEAALLHALDELSRKGQYFSAILTLPPTSPLRKPQTISSFVKKYYEISNKFDALLSLSEHRGDFWIQEAEGSFRRLFPEAPRRRQERQPLYLENSALYITRVDALRETGFILGRSSTGYIISEREALDINEPLDLTIAEKLLNEKQ